MKSEGFTLIEILLAVAIVGLLGSLSMPAYNTLTGITRSNVCARNRETLAHAEAMFLLAEGRHSNIIQDLVDQGYLKDTPRCPSGYEYTWQSYDPSDPNYQSIPVCPAHNPGDLLSSLYGNIVMSTRYIELFDSGAVLSKLSELSYIPDYAESTVAITLASGVEVQTDPFGGAMVTLADGTLRTIEDIYDPWEYVKRDVIYSEDGMEYSTDYVMVGYGYAYEGDYTHKYLNYEYSYDSDTGSYSYDSANTYSSTYSGASLSTDYGYIYEGTYTTNEPSESSYTYNVEEDGSYSGSSKYSNNVSDQYNYGYNNQGTSSQFAYSLDGTYDYSYETDYSYDADTKTYQSTSGGTYSYVYDYDFGSTTEDIAYADTYTYTGDYTYNHATGGYSSNYTYDYESGTSFTYAYSYDPVAKTRTYTYTNNVTGQTTTITY